MGINVGSFVRQGTGVHADSRRFPDIRCDAWELSAHVGKPWLRAYIADHLALPFPVASSDVPPTGDATVPFDQPEGHALIVGTTGGGKTRLALHLLAEKMRAGCSVVAIDPKEATIRHLLAAARDVGIAPEKVSLLLPSAGALPGWNPLLGDAPETTAADFLQGVKESTNLGAGSRMEDLFTNALLAMTAHGLSLYEMARFLRRSDYQKGLLAMLPKERLRSHAFDELQDYFGFEFSGFTSSGRAEAVSPVLNKVREFIRSPFLQAVLCARRNTLDLPALWREQRIVLIHLDFARLGSEGAHLLGAQLAHGLFLTAQREGVRADAVPVVLSLDEIGVAERFYGGVIQDVLSLARSYKLQLLLSCQYLSQVSTGLREALLALTRTQALFQLSPGDADIAARLVASALPDRVTRVSVDVAQRDRVTGEPETTPSYCRIHDAWGNPLRLSEPAYQALLSMSPSPGHCGEDPRPAALRTLLGIAGLPDRAYVHDPVTGEARELFGYVRGIAPGSWRFDGPRPLGLFVRFPRPRVRALASVSGTDQLRQMAARLSDLPARHALLRTPGGSQPPGIIRVRDVPDLSHSVDGYLLAVASHGLSQKDIAATYEGRKAEADRIQAMGKALMVPPAPTAPRTTSSPRSPVASTTSAASAPGPAPRTKSERAARAREARVPGAAPAVPIALDLTRLPDLFEGDVADDGSL